MRIKVGSKTIYNVKIYKPCGKHYMVDGLIKEGDYCLYTTNHNKYIKRARFVLIDIFNEQGGFYGIWRNVKWIFRKTS